MENLTVDQFVKLVTDNAKTKKWLSCTMPVIRSDGEVFSIGIKSFGKWVQVIQCGCYMDGIPEQKTIKALKEELTKVVTQFLNLQ